MRRKNTYFCFFVPGFILYVTMPYAGNAVLFILSFCIIISMYGGGFSTVPAYLRGMFGARHVGAIHGLLLAAWSAAGIFGPVLVNYIRQQNVDHGMPNAQACETTMYIMAGLLLIDFVRNLPAKAVDHRFHIKSGNEVLAPASAGA